MSIVINYKMSYCYFAHIGSPTHQTLSIILGYTILPQMQVLTFLRTGVKVNGLDAVSIFLGEKDLKLHHSPADIQGALRSLDWGISDSKDFLDPSKSKCKDYITRKTGLRKRAVNIYLSKIPQELQDAIKKGAQLHYKEER